MQILCISDSHGAAGAVLDVLYDNPTAKHVFFLGDGLNDITDIFPIFNDRTFYTVLGNCDFNPFYKLSDTAVLENKKIFYTHGHIFNVKNSLLPLKKEADKINADIILYGHTHTAGYEFYGTRLILCPGSINPNKSSFASYALISIENGQIIPTIKRA